MIFIKNKIKKIIKILPEEKQQYIKDCYHYIKLFPRLCMLNIQFKILKLIKHRDKTIKTLHRKNNNYANNQLSKTKQILIIKDFKKAQLEINSSLFNSLTHRYDIKKLKPIRDLKYRLNVINNIAPNFFTGNNFLDIGCSKGFFSLLASQSFDRVQSIDANKEFIKLYKIIKQPNMEVFHGSFRDFMPLIEFDKIFINNVYPCVFKEYRDYEWVYKLAAISTDKVLIEGSVDVNYKDINSIIPDELQSKYTFEKLVKAMHPFFSLEKKISLATPGCWAILFQRRKSALNDNKTQWYNLPVLKIFRDSGEWLIYLTKIKNKKVVAKIKKNYIGTDLKIKINIASFSPISNGTLGGIYKDEKFIGWIEKYNSSPIYKAEENQVKLFKLLCDHNIFLTKLGYFDADFAAHNFFKQNDKLFDKGYVMHVKTINKDVYGDSFSNRCQRFCFHSIVNNYNFINKEIQKQIYKALKSKDSNFIEHIFTKIKNQL